MLEHLLRTFVYEYNQGHVTWTVTPQIAEKAGSLFAKAMVHQFGDEEDEFRIRLSALGYPALYQVLPLYGYTKTRPTDIKTLKVFMRGELLEIFLLSHLQAFAPELEIEHNPEISYCGYSGHPDLVLTLGEEKTIIEAKSVSKFYAQQFLVNPNDERGYLSQLLVYMHVMDVATGYFLVEVDETKELYMIRIRMSDYHSIIEEALATLETLKEIETLKPPLDIALSRVGIPAPVPAFIKHGTYAFPTIPPSLKYSPHNDCLYELERVEGSTRPMVSRIRTIQEIIQCLTNSSKQDKPPTNLLP